MLLIQDILRMCVVKLKEYFRIDDRIDVNHCLRKIKIPVWVQTDAGISELTSNLTAMGL